MEDREQAVLSKAQKLNHWNSRKLYYDVSKKHQRQWTLKRGEVYFVDLGENVGSEENKIRPCVVLQANAYNFRSPVFTCAIVSTSTITIPDIQIPIIGEYYYNDRDHNRKKLVGAVDLGQIKTVAKERIVRKACVLAGEMEDMDQKLFNVFGLSPVIKKKNNIITSLEGKIDYLKDKLQDI